MAILGDGAVSGPLKEQVTAVSANYTVLKTDQLVQVTTGAGVVVVSLPAPTQDNAVPGQFGNAGQRVTIEKYDTGGGSVTVAGALNIGNVYKLASRWSQASFVSDGVLWNLTATVS